MPGSALSNALSPPDSPKVESLQRRIRLLFLFFFFTLNRRLYVGPLAGENSDAVGQAVSRLPGEWTDLRSSKFWFGILSAAPELSMYSGFHGTSACGASGN